jgi:hypothetical protein
MRRIITALTLIAFAAGSVPPWQRLAAAQEVSPETSQRLRDAVDRLRDGEDGESTGIPPLDRLDEAAIEDLVAPFALYPDALLAQVLVAATYPDQITRANDLISRTDGMSDAELATALEAEDWDPSVLVLLSGFPTVITRMAEDPEATRRLGTAMIDQDQDVLAAAQRLRVKAEAAGNLTSNAAQTVTRTDGEISIRPAKRETVYVPRYDPATVYTPSQVSQPYVQTQAPAVQSGSTAQTALIAGAVAFGGGLLVSQLFKDDDKPDSGWDDYWHRDRVIDWRDRQFYPRSDRVTRSETWGYERDRYWDRTGGRWSRDEAARRQRQEERRSALRWTGYGEAGRDRDRKEFAAWREHAAREQAREERAAAEKRAARQERRKEADRRAKAEQEAKAKAAAERKRDRDAQRAREDRARHEAAKAEAARAREKEKAHEKKAADKKAAEKKNTEKKTPKPVAPSDKKAEPKPKKKSDQAKPDAKAEKSKHDKPKQDKAKQDKPKQAAPSQASKPKAQHGQEKKQNHGKCREGDDRAKCK